MDSIKDLIYFDYDKAKSINSQLSGGIISEITKAIENEVGLDSEIGFDIKLLKGKIGAGDKDKSIRTERIELFHELLNQLEQSLIKHEVLTNINDSLDNFESSFDNFLETIPHFTYVKASGWSAFEDFDRFQRIMNNFNEIQRLIFTSALDNNPEIIQLKEQLNDLKKELKSHQRGNTHKELQKLKALEKRFDKTIEEESGAIFLDELFIERVKTFMDTFSPNRLNFRLAPFDSYNNFQILASLKNKYLVNSDFENIIYTYGSRPNVKLSVIGIITSCPQRVDSRIDLREEFNETDDSELSEEASFEMAFRNVFSSFEGFEKFFFAPSFPKISISPIAIYREVKINK
ncbi:hypothetical protein [Draconibacterium orientale]|uniref:DUF6414 family protein n=1 Tax=Draconibacterium orientale TaxID=1168034 RepID=UPI0029BFB037|nr:hypothetical protein [Draconibacterium orientale]